MGGAQLPCVCPPEGRVPPGDTISMNPTTEMPPKHAIPHTTGKRAHDSTNYLQTHAGDAAYDIIPVEAASDLGASPHALPPHHPPAPPLPPLVQTPPRPSRSTLPAPLLRTMPSTSVPRGPLSTLRCPRPPLVTPLFQSRCVQISEGEKHSKNWLAPIIAKASRVQ